MRIVHGAVALVAFSTLIACSQHVESESTGKTTRQADVSIEKPIPLVLQFVGSYSSDGSDPGGLSSVELRRDGTYSASFDDGSREDGAFNANRTVSWPINVRLTSWDGHQWRAQITGYDQKLVVAIDGDSGSLTADATVGPDEAICDQSGGTWSDDDADPKTGLYCVCPDGSSYIPSQGGCVQ